jgi:hypothetical protein
MDNKIGLAVSISSLFPLQFHPPALSSLVPLLPLLTMVAATATGIGTGMAPVLHPAAVAAHSNRLIIPSALTSPSLPPGPIRRSGSRPFRGRLLSAPAVSRSSSDGAAALSSSSSGNGASASVLTFQQAIQRLQEYWASVGCAVMQCSNTEVPLAHQLFDHLLHRHKWLILCSNSCRLEQGR